MQITSHEWEHWANDPCTKAFVEKLQFDIETTKSRWAAQAFMNLDDAAKSDRANLYALAGIDILSQVIEMVEEMRPQPEEKE